MTKSPIPEDVMEAAYDAHLAAIGRGTAQAVRIIASAIMAERERCAAIASIYADGYEAALPHYGAADKDSGRGRQEGHIKAGRDIAKAIMAGREGE